MTSLVSAYGWHEDKNEQFAIESRNETDKCQNMHASSRNRGQRTPSNSHNSADQVRENCHDDICLCGCVGAIGGEEEANRCGGIRCIEHKAYHLTFPHAPLCPHFFYACDALVFFC